MVVMDTGRSLPQRASAARSAAERRRDPVITAVPVRRGSAIDFNGRRRASLAAKELHDPRRPLVHEGQHHDEGQKQTAPDSERTQQQPQETKLEPDRSSPADGAIPSDAPAIDANL